MRSNVAANMAMGGGGDASYNSEPIELGGAAASSGAAAGASKGAMGGAGGMAAMMALQAYSNVKAAQQKEKEDKYKAQLDHRNSMSSALDGLISTTRGLRL